MRLVECRINELLDGRPQTWLAYKTGLNKSSINRMLKGGIPELPNAVKIARVFGVTVEEIWVFDEEKRP